jgi:lipid II:glycine glycyltransferase (peptidoglycan interpeptide bridge formation enzyme)
LKIVHDVGRDEWLEFVTGDPEGNVFQTPEMDRVYERTEGQEPVRAFAVENDRLQGVLLATLIWNGRWPLSGLSCRCVVQGGPLSKKAEASSQLLKELDRSVSRRASYTEIRNLSEHKSRIPPFESLGYAFAPHLNYRIDLRAGESAIWSKMSKGRRKGISKTEKIGLEVVEVKSDRQFEDFYDILKGTYSGLGLPLAHRSFFESARSILTPINKARFLLCNHGGKPIACRAFLLFKKTIYDWYAGSLMEGRAKKADEFLVWDALRWGVSHDYETFDFGGAGAPEEEYGPREFKRRFGGKLIEPGRFKKIYMPTRLWISSRAFKVFRRLR